MDKRRIGQAVKEDSRNRATDQKAGSGRPKSIRIVENIEVIDELAQSQENEEPGSHDTPREIEFQTGIPTAALYG